MNRDENKTKSANEAPKKDVYVSDLNYSLRYARCLLRMLGIWPLVASRPMKIEYFLSQVMLLPLVAISLISIPMPICCYVVTRPINRLELIVLLAPITFQAANILMHVAMIVRSGTIKICFEHVELDWRRIENSEERDIMMRYVRFSHTLTIACILFMYTGALSYSLIMPLLSGNTINEMNETIRPRPFPGTEIFFDVQANVVYEIVFFVNFVSAILHYTVATAVCNLAIVLVSHACAQIQIVMSNIDSFVDRIDENNDNDNLIAKQIGFIVRRHVRLIKFAMNIDQALSEMILIEVVATTLLICFIEYDILILLEENESNALGIATYSMLFVSFTFNLFLYCQFGEVLRGECEKVGKRAYMIDWFRLPGRTKLTLIMIINMSHNPCKLTAGGIMELSIFNFASVLKSSFAYFNMMRRVG